MRWALPVGLLAVWAWLTFVPAPPLPRSSLAEDFPRPTEPIAPVAVPATIDDLEREIAKVAEREHITGVSIALVPRDAPMSFIGVGVRDRETRAPMTGDTVFRVGSISKSIIALGVMRLVDQGKLDVDRPLREILPDLEFANAWEAIAPITLAQCMEHTAGFDDIRFNEIYGPEDISVTDTLARNPRSRTARWRPGTRHGYTNVGYTVAARAIEVVTGEPFDVYLRREILAPMGILDADFRRTPALEARLATGYMENDDPVVFRSFAHRPSGSFLASAADLGKLVKFWIARGEGYGIVSRAGLERIERAGTLPFHTDADYGFANYGDVMHPIHTRGHDGGMPGFHASFRYIPSLGVGYALLLNSNYTFRGYFELRSLIFNYLTKGHTFAAPAIASDRPGASYFALANPRHELFAFMDVLRIGLRVADHDDHLEVAGLEGEHFQMFPTPDGGYRFEYESGSSSRFTVDADGKPIMIIASFFYGEAADETSARLKLAAFDLAKHLMAIAPLYAIALLVIGALRRTKVVPTAVLLWPAIAALACGSLDYFLLHGFFAGVIGDVHPLTIGLCAVTILFPVASVATLHACFRALVRSDRPRLLPMVFPIACGIAFTGVALWFAANGMVGLRTWSY